MHTYIHKHTYKFDMPHLYTSITQLRLSLLHMYTPTHKHTYPHIQSLIPPPMLLS